MLNTNHILKSALSSLSALLIAATATAETVLTDQQINELYNATRSGAVPTRATCHDPSVIIGYEGTDGIVRGEETEGSKKIYCIFGSHRAWYKTYDMQNWRAFTNNLSSQSNYRTIFAPDAEWSKLGGGNYTVDGNMWAPDVVWNKTMKKWCMYMSINGDKWFSQIVLLTADNLVGDWTRVGAVVYSGFTASTWTKTDMPEVLNVSSLPSRYTLNRNGNQTYGQNCIDACSFYDEDGNLWLTYGSWFGGLYMLRLDPATGLRNKNYTYATDNGTAEMAKSDAYMGIKIAGGCHVSGEASYIQYIGDRYYLFVTNGGLDAKGGYNMRVFSSKSVTGPYLDMSGQDARYLSSGTANSSQINNADCPGTINGRVGTRLMSYYRWSFLDKGFCAQGHNSAIVDTDGKAFLVYHTRFDQGTEEHQVRVHQLFQAKTGALVAAPMEYRGESLAKIEESAIPGSYGLMLHGTGTDYAKLSCVTDEVVTLNADGTITGAKSGTWTLDEDGMHISFTVSGVTYHGVIIEQYIEETNTKALCFSGTSNTDVCAWGYKQLAPGQVYPDNQTVAINVKKKALSFKSSVFSGTTLKMKAKGIYGAEYVWTPSDTNIINNDGLVKPVSEKTLTTLTETVSCGDYSYSKSVRVTVAGALPLPDGLTDNKIMGRYASGDEIATTTPSTEISDETGLSISFNVSGLTSDWDKVAQSTDGNYIMYLSVLHYLNNDFYEAKATNSAAATAAMSTEKKENWQLFLNGSYFVTVSFNPDGTIEYYRDGKLMLTFGADLTPSWHGYGSTATPASIVKSVVNYYKKKQLKFLRSVDDVIIGTAVGFSRTNALRPIDRQNVELTTLGEGLISVSSAKDVTVLSLSGQTIYHGRPGVISVGRPGLYIVVTDGASTKVLVK